MAKLSRLHAAGGAACLALALFAGAIVVACDGGEPAQPGPKGGGSVDDGGVTVAFVCTNAQVDASSPVVESSARNDGDAGADANADGGDAASDASVADASNDAATPLRIRGTVEESVGNGPLPGALVAVRSGNEPAVSNRALADPAYVLGARTDSNGAFDVAPRLSAISVDVFAANENDACLSKSYDVSGGVDRRDTIALVTSSASKPTIAKATATPNPVAPGAVFVLRATVKAGSASDPLSSKVLLVEPSSGVAAALDPPCAGSVDGAYPDGEYRRSVRAPSTPGTYAYYLTAATKSCATAQAVPIEVVVK